MDAFPTSLVPLDGGFSGETFLADAAGEQVVVRVYAGRSAARGPLAPEVDAAVLRLVRGLLPVPAVLEVRRGDPSADVPGLLVTERLPGERLDLVLPRLDAEGLATVGAEVGTLLGRLGHMVQPGAGLFADHTLALADLPADDLPTWVEAHADALGDLAPPVRDVAERAQDLLDLDLDERRHVLVHGDLNPKNLLVDPETLVLTGVVDWEFAFAGSPWTDLGNTLRFDRAAPWADAVVAAYRAMVPGTPDDLLDRARAADLVALVDLAARREETEVVLRARSLLAAIADAGDLHARPPV